MLGEAVESCKESERRMESIRARTDVPDDTAAFASPLAGSVALIEGFAGFADGSTLSAGNMQACGGVGRHGDIEMERIIVLLPFRSDPFLPQRKESC